MAALLIAAERAQAQPTSLDDVVVFARSSVKVKLNARQLKGHIVVNDPGGTTSVHPYFKTVPDFQPQLVADTVTVQGVGFPGPFLFDVFTNNFLDPKNTAVIQGTLTQPIGTSLPLFAFPSPVVVTPGTTDVTVNRLNSPITLAAGDYDVVRVHSDSTLYLTGGTYNVRSLMVATRAELLVNGTTTINVADRARLGGRSILGSNGGMLPGRCIVLNIAGTHTTTLGPYADVTALVSAPLGRVRVGLLGNYRGTFTAARVIVGRGVSLEVLPPLTEACP